DKSVFDRLSQTKLRTIEAVQRMLARIGIGSTIYRERRAAGHRELPDGRGGRKPYATAALHDLVISGSNLARFAQRVGFADVEKAGRLEALLSDYKRALNSECFTATVEAIEDDGVEAVFDVNVSGIHAFDANGLYVHNCGEQ